ncbi:Cytochrome P450 2J5 [Folsomia candida]|uniref:Cytochrome P450 2J5 n=1 Tax=Folsomia candida TaxID=158441 RepID=A0A226D7T3_FOLCA|nr:Cytochrome P450 2J5 [Folsomia candida]
MVNGQTNTVQFVGSVIISDFKMLKEIYSLPAATGRMHFSRLLDIVPGGDRSHGIAFNEGPDWEELRHFTARQIRQEGLARDKTEDMIMQEVMHFIDSLVSNGGAPVTNVKGRLLLMTACIVSGFTSGSRRREVGLGIIEIMQYVQKTFTELHTNFRVLFFLPILAKLFPVLSGYTIIREVLGRFTACFKIPIDDHLNSYSPDFDRDFTDAFITQMRNTTDKQSPFYGKVGEDNLLATLADIYFGGTDTTSTTLTWLILYVSKMPEIQKKLQDEIESITGNVTPIGTMDRAR